MSAFVAVVLSLAVVEDSLTVANFDATLKRPGANAE